MLTETEIWFVATFYKKIASILLKTNSMDMILSTPGQWYLDYLDNGLWSALQNF